MFRPSGPASKRNTFLTNNNLVYDATKPYKKEISAFIRQTWETPYVSVNETSIKKKFSYDEWQHTDGVGTKGIYHWHKRSFRNAVIDALAMNLNDLALKRATPYLLTNHILLPEDDSGAIVEIMRCMTEECKGRYIAIPDGETSIHDNIDGMDISISAAGFIKRPKPNILNIGDVLVGFGSNGLHSNGFTKVRKIFGEECRPDFVKPTLIYSGTILAMDQIFDIRGMMHITGGAFTKLGDILQAGDVVIDNEHGLEPQEIFHEIYRRGVSDEEMYKNFNCGVGIVLGLEKSHAEELIYSTSEFDADIIGEVVPGKGNIRIKSKFSDKEVVY